MNPSIPSYERRRMLREVVTHEEALHKESWANPPLAPGDNAASYAEMMQDPTVSYAVGLLQDAILAADWSVEPAEATAPALAAAIDLEKNLRDIDIESALFDALDAVWRGFRAQEITWRYSDRRFRLDSLAAIDPDQVAFQLDDQMRVVSILSKPAGGEAQELPTSKVWLHVHRSSRTRPAGESILEPAFRAWQSKDRLLQFWGRSIQRFGMTNLKVTIPSNTPAARQAQLLSMLYDGRLDGVYLIPDDVLVEPMNPTQWANLTFEQAIDYQDAEILKAILFTYQPGGSASGQTYITGAGLSEQARATAYRLGRISRALERSFTRQVIAPLCESNWGLPPAGCPQLRIGKPDAGRIVTLAPALTSLVAAGIADPATAAEQLGLPEPTGGARSVVPDGADRAAPSNVPGADRAAPSIVPAPPDHSPRTTHHSRP